jgi:hypothetical protein
MQLPFFSGAAVGLVVRLCGAERSELQFALKDSGALTVGVKSMTHALLVGRILQILSKPKANRPPKDRLELMRHTSDVRDAEALAKKLCELGLAESRWFEGDEDHYPS